MQVVVSKHQKKNRYFHLSGSLKKIGKYVGRGNKRSIAEAVVDNSAIRGEVVCALMSKAHKEITKLCSDSNDSILRMTTKPALEHFTWDRVWHELQHSAPLLLSLLTNLLPPAKREAVSIRPALCVCASIFLKVQNHKLNVVQTMIGLVLRAGHANKQVHCIYYVYIHYV